MPTGIIKRLYLLREKVSDSVSYFVQIDFDIEHQNGGRRWGEDFRILLQILE
jgi:hypothetical protein